MKNRTKPSDPKRIKTYKPKVILVTVCYNDATRLLQYIHSVKKIHYPSFRLIFVDNNSADSSVSIMKRECPDSIIIRSIDNLGTTGGYNLGFRKALDIGVDYIMTLAIDVKLKPDCVEKLVGLMESDRRIGAAGPILFYSDEPYKIQMYGGSINMKTGIGVHDFNSFTDLSVLPTIRDAQYLDGGTMMIKSEALRKVSGFDERFFMYLEDSDLSIRFHKNGYRTTVLRNAQALHFHRQNRGAFPSKLELFYLTRNRYYFIQKHKGMSEFIKYIFKTIYKHPKHILYYLKYSKIDLSLSYLYGTIAGIFQCMGKSKI